MATTPRIPEELVKWMKSGGYYAAEATYGAEATGTRQSGRATALTANPELQKLAGIPVNVVGGLQVDPVLAELCRILNAQTQGCIICQTGRNAVALQSGLDEDMVAKIAYFEQSDLPDATKAALRIAQAVASYPKGANDEVWEAARAHFTDEQLTDIVFFSAFTTGNKINVTLGLDPGPSERPWYPTDDIYAAEDLTEEIEALRRRGIQVAPDEDERIVTATSGN